MSTSVSLIRLMSVFVSYILILKMTSFSRAITRHPSVSKARNETYLAATDNLAR
jgi:hypothetical protein